jgi:hypothetical protein
MNTAGFARALRAYSRRRPFRSYVLEFVTGEPLTVGHPEAVTIDGNVIVYRSQDGLYRLFDSESVCQLRDVSPPPDA